MLNGLKVNEHSAEEARKWIESVYERGSAPLWVMRFKDALDDLALVKSRLNAMTAPAPEKPVCGCDHHVETCDVCVPPRPPFAPTDALTLRKALETVQRLHPTPWVLEQANDRGIRIECGHRVTALSRTFTDDDRRDFSDLMHDDIDFHLALMDLVNGVSKMAAP